jgi:hypothetical protein
MRSALAGTGGTGGASRAACSLAVVDSCESDACRNLSIEKRRGFTEGRGDAGGELPESRVFSGRRRSISLDTGRPPSSDTAMRSGARYSVLLSPLSPFPLRLKRPAGSNVLLNVERRRRSFSDLPGRRRIVGEAVRAEGAAAHVRVGGLTVQYMAHGGSKRERFTVRARRANWCLDFGVSGRSDEAPTLELLGTVQG